MTKEVKKYLNKRRKIMGVLSDIKAVYESDECHHESNPDFWECREKAELIMSLFGVNKPDFIKQEESKGYAIG